MSCIFRVGHGYDVHRLVPNRPLILGGVNIPFDLGLLGHSDADVLTHAVMDALLGAAALRDIGYHFPDSDDAYKNANSLHLARQVAHLLDENGYAIGNVDATLIAQKPKVSTYIEQMRKALSDALQIDFSLVNIKATTEEGLGFTGDASGMSAHAVCLIYKK